MDILLLFYASIFGIILISPFLYFSYVGSTNDIDITESKLLIERKMLLENLRDLKTDFETKKFSEFDFNNLSADIIKKLESIDKKIPSGTSTKIICSCGKNDHSEIAKFCYNCGKILKI